MPHSYIFFDTEPAIAGLSKTELESCKKDFVTMIESNAQVRTRAYSTLAFKAGMRFMLHLHADEASIIQDFVRDLLHTELGRHLKITYTLLGLRRPSPYNPKGTLS